MAEVLVLVDHTDGEVKKVTFELLTLARRLGEPSAVLRRQRLRRREGDARRSTARPRSTSPRTPRSRRTSSRPAAEVLAKLVADASPAAVLLASGAEGKEIAAPAGHQDRLRA